MADRPVFSVVIAAYNAARTLPSTIRSVLAQTRADFEILVVDDGSTDGTESVLQNIQDDRIVYVRQENLGPAAARNAGIQRASGELVSVLDSDDLWLPTYLETMDLALRAVPDAGLAYTDAWRLDDVTRRIHRQTIMAQQRPPRRPPDDPEVELLERRGDPAHLLAAADVRLLRASSKSGCELSVGDGLHFTAAANNILAAGVATVIDQPQS